MNSCEDMIIRSELVVVTGVGKSYKMAELFASLLQSVGITALAEHATDLLHGSAGLIQSPRTVTIMLSHSGRTAELMPVNHVARRTVLITGGDDVINADCIERYSIERDGSRHGTIPANSLLEQMKIINRVVCFFADHADVYDLAMGHPGGTLYEGKK